MTTISYKLSCCSVGMSCNTMEKSATAAEERRPMVDVEDFAGIIKSMSEEDEMRETLIKKSREVLKSSKNSIYDIHRNSVEKAKATLQAAKTILINDLLPVCASHPSLRHSLSGAMEEYAEAVIFLYFITERRLPTLGELEVTSRDEYLGGLMDAIGELNRYAVLKATVRDVEAVKLARDYVDQAHHQLMLFDWRNGNLRRKYDGIKYTLKKLEQIIYELALTGTSAFVPKSGAEDAVEMEGGGAGAVDDGDGNTADATTGANPRFKHPKRPRSPTS